MFQNKQPFSVHVVELYAFPMHLPRKIRDSEVGQLCSSKDKHTFKRQGDQCTMHRKSIKFYTLITKIRDCEVGQLCSSKTNILAKGKETYTWVKHKSHPQGINLGTKKPQRQFTNILLFCVLLVLDLYPTGLKPMTLPPHPFLLGRCNALWTGACWQFPHTITPSKAGFYSASW